VRGNTPEKSAREWMEARLPGYEEILTMGRMLAMGIDNEGPGTMIINMFWEVVDLQGASVDLLTSDQPVTRFQGLASPEACIMIPLDRRRLFLATHQDRRFRDWPQTVLAEAANESTVRAARAYVYATGAQHMELVEKYLVKSPASPPASARRRAPRAGP
jgi:hypothetical protein